MLPRKSFVIRYTFTLFMSAFLLTLWWTAPSRYDVGASWWHFFKPLNISAIRLEFEALRNQLNSSLSIENKTVEEVVSYINEMKKQLPANPHFFRYIFEPTRVCEKQDIFLLIYVHTAPDHYKRRTLIRELWGNPRNFKDVAIRCVFLVGKPRDAAIQDALSMESEQYQDIVQEDFMDSYRNLTYKAIMGLKWISSHCRNARFLLKIDDDIFVNVFNVVSHLRSLVEHKRQTKRLLLCLVWYKMKVVRNPKSKWYLSPEEYKDEYFPTYCSGSAFIMSTDVAIGMYNVSFQVPFFWVDDFYITGLLAKKLQIEHQKFNSVYILGPSKFLEKFTEDNRWRTLVYGHVHNMNQMRFVWNRVLQDRKIISVPQNGTNVIPKSSVR
jgi:hypothetical protein